MVDYQAKYESLLRNVLRDLNSEVLTAQERAEKNAEASSVYCTALKERLLKREAELEERKKELAALTEELSCTKSQLAEARAKLEIYAEKEAEKVTEKDKLPKAVGKESEQPIDADSTCMSSDGHVTNSAVLDFLSGLSAVSVSRCVQGSSTTTFNCQVTDGSLAGHTFTLTLDTESGEFTYDPVQTSPTLSSNSPLVETTCFPDFMQSRFLLNLLTATFMHSSSSSSPS